MAQRAIIQKLKTLLESQLATIDLLIEQGSKQPQNNSWSPHQVFQHIVSSQAGTIKVMIWKREKGDFKSIPFSHKFNFLLLKLFFRFNFKTKAPSVVPPPTEETLLIELKSQVQNQHKSFLSEIENLAPENLSKAVFRHPITGLMNAAMTVQFLRLHWEHHRKQILTRMQ